MRFPFFFISVAALIGMGHPALGKSETVCFDVQGMTCALCELTLKTAVKKLKGVSLVKASMTKKSAQVEFDPALTNKDEIKRKIDDAGYSATIKGCKF